MYDKFAPMISSPSGEARVRLSKKAHLSYIH
jgi:hypothetical protein